jgi:hypothetical protein
MKEIQKAESIEKLRVLCDKEVKKGKIDFSHSSRSK